MPTKVLSLGWSTQENGMAVAAAQMSVESLPKGVRKIPTPSLMLCRRISLRTASLQQASLPQAAVSGVVFTGGAGQGGSPNGSMAAAHPPHRARGMNGTPQRMRGSPPLTGGKR